MDTNTNTNIDINEQNQGGENNSNPNSNPDVKTYTAEEVAKLIQAEADRRTNQALAKQKKEYEKKMSLSNLDEQQRKDAEQQMKIAELEEQLAAFQIEKNRSELKSVLSSRGLSAEFADIIAINDDIEASQSNIDKLDRLFKAAVKSEVEKRLAGNAPLRGAGDKPTYTKESVKKMSIAELSELQRTQPEVFAKFFD